MADLLAALKSARTDKCRMYLARRVVQARFERGDYEILGELGVEIREAMARKLVEELKK